MKAILMGRRHGSKKNSDIAKKLKLSTGTVSNRLQEGSAYLAKSLLTSTKSEMA